MKYKKKDFPKTEPGQSQQPRLLIGFNVTKQQFDAVKSNAASLDVKVAALVRKACEDAGLFSATVR